VQNASICALGDLMAQDIATTLATVKQGIARTNLFSIGIQGGGAGNISRDLEFRGKGTQLPSSDLGVIEIPYRGRKLKVPGQRTFAEWTVTIMETEGMEVRAAIEQWINKIDNAETGQRGDGSLLSDITVKMLTTKGGTSLTYTLYGAFPTSMASVDLSFDEQTAPLEYQVTFNYSYHTVNGAGSSNSSGSGGGFNFPSGLPIA